MNERMEEIRERSEKKRHPHLVQDWYYEDIPYLLAQLAEAQKGEKMHVSVVANLSIDLGKAQAENARLRELEAEVKDWEEGRLELLRLWQAAQAENARLRELLGEVLRRQINHCADDLADELWMVGWVSRAHAALATPEAADVSQA